MLNRRVSCVVGWGALVFGLGAGGAASAGQIVHVDRDALGGANDGSSWADAFIDLQAALAAVEADPGSYGEIWIAGGVYTPAPPGGDRFAAFVLVDGVPLRGGFEGDETDPSQRPPKDAPGAPETLLSGDLNGDDDGLDNLGENSVVVVGAGSGDSVVLDRLTVSDGYRDVFGGFSPLAGTGFVSIARDLLVTDCRFTDNRTNFTVGGNVLIAAATMTARFEGCLFRNNTAEGGLRVNGGALSISSHDAEAEIVGCLFESNSVATNEESTRGGALYSEARVTRITDSVFRGNSATITGSDAQFASSLGGAVFAEARLQRPEERQLFIERCTFEDNTASVTDAQFESYADGGAIWAGAATSIRSSDFLRNRIESVNEFGRGEAVGGALIVTRQPSFAELIDCRFIENSAVTNTQYLWGSAAALFLEGPLTIEGCVFEANSAEHNISFQSSPGTSGVLEVFAFSALITDTVFSENTYSAGQTTLSERNQLAAVQVFASTLELRRCTLVGNTITIADIGIGANLRTAAALHTQGGAIDAESVIVQGNTITTPDGTPFGFVQPSAAWLLDADDVTVANALVAGNEAPEAAGIAIERDDASSLSILSSTIAGNTSESATAAGVLANSPADVANSIVWSNSSAAGTALARQLDLAVGSTVDSSIVEGWDGSIPGARTIDADPQFADAAAGDYTPISGSPAVDSGDNAAVPVTLTTDLAGNPRVSDDPGTPDDGADGSFPVVDRGAFEFLLGPCGPADLAEPFSVLDLADLVAFVQAFTSEQPEADLAEPAGVWDLADVTAFVSGFLAGCP